MVINGFQTKVACMLVDRICKKMTINPCTKRFNLSYISLIVKLMRQLKKHVEDAVTRDIDNVSIDLDNVELIKLIKHHTITVLKLLF